MTFSSYAEHARLSLDIFDTDNAAWIVLRGEADIANADYLDTVLSRIAPDGATHVRLEVSDLTFIDVSTFRHLTAFAARMKQEGRTVVTSGAGPTLRRMAVELDVHEELGLD